MTQHWQQGYVHLATVKCPSCRGDGCRFCKFRGEGEVGCGGDAERDINNPTLANCIAEDRLVSPDEVTRQ